MAADGRPGPMARWRESSGTVRVRTTAAAVLVVGIALVISAVAVVVLLQRSLTSNVRSAALLQARAVAEDVQAGQRGAPAVDDVEEEFVQVLDSDGRVVDSSDNLETRTAVARLTPGESRRIERVPIPEDEPFLVVAISAAAPGGPRTVLVGRSLEPVAESSYAITRILWTGIPVLLVVLGMVLWRVVGRALAPVEAIRAEVDAISSKELHRRVPDPPGNDEVARLASTMNQMLARLQEGQTRQRRFVSDASHELRSPVTTIRQHAEVALTHPDKTSMHELAEVVLEENVRLQRLVEDLLLLARMDEGTLAARTESVDLDDLIFEEADRLRGSTGLKIDTSGVSAGRVSGDKDQLQKLVRNLTDNAARHARSKVGMSLRRQHSEIVLSVDDDGDGIPAPERSRVFERFVRLDEARDRDSGGSGLGLAIVAEIAAAHGASVSVLEGPLGGARFEVRLPSATG